MELIVISESRIKLMLTKEDMDSYKGDTHRVLSRIMEDVRGKCGCGNMNGRLYIQMYQSRSGGCEMFVTKLRENTCGTDEYSMKTLNEKYTPERDRLTAEEKYSCAVYSFGDIENLLSCCRQVGGMRYGGESAAYVDTDGAKKIYYLILEYETCIAGENFGKLCPGQIRYYINEHCAPFCLKNAVEKLGSLASPVK